MKFEQFPVIVVLGSQIHHDETTGEYSLALHTHMKTEAASIALRKGMTEKVILSGGYNFGVRYDDAQIISPPDFRLSSFSRARQNRISEAQAMFDIAVQCFDAPADYILLEELSATTEENAAAVNIMLKRSTFSGMTKVGVLALLHHLPRALTIFKTACTSFQIEPVIAEDLLTTKGETEIDKIAKYYAEPRGNKKWDTKRIRALLTEGKSLAEMME